MRSMFTMFILCPVKSIKSVHLIQMNNEDDLTEHGKHTYTSYYRLMMQKHYGFLIASNT